MNEEETFKDKFKRFNWDTRLKKLMFWAKIVVIVCLLISGMLNSVTGWAVQQIEVSCIEDQGFLLFSSMNNYFCTNTFYASLLVTINTLFCDFLFICSSLRFIFCRTTLRPAVFFLTIIPLSAITRQFFWTQIPEGSCWPDPIIPSLILPYSESPSFFFSCTTGVLFFFILENSLVKNWILFSLSILTLCSVSMSALILRKDYSVGLITGIGIGHYIWIISEPISAYLEAWYDQSHSEQGLSIQ
jgi:hypothetical protein